VIEIRKYQDRNGRIPIDEWINALRDSRARTRIQLRIDRLEFGLEGDWKSVGEGVRELRIPVGKGYRVYYAWSGEAFVLLLCGGDKSTQRKDILQAQSYWKEYRHGQ